MPANVEIKARVADLETLSRRAAELSDGPPNELEQEDLFFNSSNGRLKLRSFADGTGELIYYERPDATGPSTSRYVRVGTADPAGLREVLSQACGVRGVVRKRRRLFLSGQTRIHLDRVEGLGDFVELEVVLRPDQTPGEGSRIALELMGSLGIEEQRLVEVAYIDLI